MTGGARAGSFRADPDERNRFQTDSMRVRKPAPRLLLAACALALAACEDAPTSPTAYRHPAGGTTWVAVSSPRGLPESRTWLPFVQGRADAAKRVEVLREEARRLRGSGELEAALRAEEAAHRLAAASVDRAPDAATLLQGFAAVDAWIGAAGRAVVSTPSPELEEAVAEVRRERARAGTLLAAGDTTGAVVHLSGAAAAARAHAPGAVALRIYARADSLVRTAGLSRGDSIRAVRLLRHTREAILTGHSGRAFRRAAYALQLVDGARR